MSRIRRWRKAYSVSPATELERARWTNSFRSSAWSSSSACPRSMPSTASTAPAQKTLPTTAASCSSRFSLVGETVEPRGDDALHRLRQLAQIAPLEQDAGVLLGVERVAAGSREQRFLRPGVEQRLLEQRAHEPRGVLVGKRRERDREGVRLAAAPGRSPLQQLRAGGADREQRDLADPLDERVDEVEQGVVGPVQVLEDEHERPLLGEALEEAAPGRDALLGAARVGLRDAGERSQVALEPRALGFLGARARPSGEASRPRSRACRSRGFPPPP